MDFQNRFSFESVYTNTHSYCFQIRACVTLAGGSCCSCISTIVACDLSSKVRETGFCSVVRLFVLLNPVAGCRSRRLVLLDAVARSLFGKHIARIASRGSRARADTPTAN